MQRNLLASTSLIAVALIVICQIVSSTPSAYNARSYIPHKKTAVFHSPAVPKHDAKDGGSGSSEEGSSQEQNEREGRAAEPEPEQKPAFRSAPGRFYSNQNYS